MGVVHALLGDRKNAFVGEEELLDGAIGGCVTAVGGVTLKVRSVKRSDSALTCVSLERIAPARRTYSLGCYLSIAVPGWCRTRTWKQELQDGVD